MLKAPPLVVLASSLLLFPSALASHAQAAPSAPVQAASVEDRRKALNALFHDYWEAYLKNNPEFASTIGDTRYNDKLSDNSVKAINDWLATEQNFLLQLVTVDSAGLSDQEKTSRDLLIHDLTEDQEGAEFKEWEIPVNQMGGIYSEYPRLVPQLSFTTAKDYDDWIARLHAIPKAFDQVSENMSIGMDDKRVPPKFLLEKTLEQVKQLANQKPEDSPLALPLKKFPASISAKEQDRIKQEMLDGYRQGGAASPTCARPLSRKSATFLRVAPNSASPRCPTAQSTTSSSSAAPPHHRPELRANLSNWP